MSTKTKKGLINIGSFVLGFGFLGALDGIVFHIVDNEGHAHLYVDGEKMNRIYGNYDNLDYLKSGTYHIKVTLNGNNHGPLTYKGEEIAFSHTLKVP